MSLTRRKSKSLKGKKIQESNNIIEHLGKYILQNTKSSNIQLMENIQNTKQYHHSFIEKISEMMDKNPGLTVEMVSTNICFTALIYQNKAVYSLIRKMLKVNDQTINNYIIHMIGSFFPEAEIVGGEDTDLMISIPKKKFPIYNSLFFIISLFSVLWVSFISYNQLLIVQEELKTNQAFSLVTDIGSAAMTCNFENIQLPKEQTSILKIVKYSNILDNIIVNNFEKALKLRQCITDPNRLFKKELNNKSIINKNYNSNGSKKVILNIGTTITPNQIENKQIMSQSLAMVPSSNVAMMVPSENMMAFIKEYNTEVYTNIETKIENDMKIISNAEELAEYFKKMGEIDISEFKLSFETQIDTSVPTLQDLKNILGIFGDSPSLFKLFIKGFAGMNIIDVVYKDYKKRMLLIHNDIIKKAADLNLYIDTVLLDADTLIKFYFSFANLFYWFMSVASIFGVTTCLMVKNLYNYLKESKKKNSKLQIENDSKIEDNNELTTTRKTRKSIFSRSRSK
jgi:hypothetical protein